MNMWYNFSYIPVSRLERDGFIVNEGNGEGYGSLSYGDGELIVEYDHKGKDIILSDIGQWRGKNKKEILKKLYDLYDIILVDESECWVERMYSATTWEEHEKIFNEAIEETKKSILGSEE